MDKPPILEVIGQHVALCRAGRQYVGLCPFHEDTNPSFSVSEDKGLFNCFSCGASGDVIDFTMKVEGIAFKDACARLGLAGEYAPRPAISATQRKAADLAAAWMAEQRRKINVLLGEVLEKIDL